MCVGCPPVREGQHRQNPPGSYRCLPACGPGFRAAARGAGCEGDGAGTGRTLQGSADRAVRPQDAGCWGTLLAEGAQEARDDGQAAAPGAWIPASPGTGVRRSCLGLGRLLGREARQQLPLLPPPRGSRPTLGSLGVSAQRPTTPTPAPTLLADEETEAERGRAPCPGWSSAERGWDPDPGAPSPPPTWIVLCLRPGRGGLSTAAGQETGPGPDVHPWGRGSRLSPALTMPPPPQMWTSAWSSWTSVTTTRSVRTPWAATTAAAPGATGPRALGSGLWALG